jgi:hypothetical protein
MQRNFVPTVVIAFFITNLLIGVSANGQGFSAEEEQFVKMAAAGGLAEVKLSSSPKIVPLIQRLRILRRKW